MCDLYNHIVDNYTRAYECLSDRRQAVVNAFVDLLRRHDLDGTVMKSDGRKGRFKVYVYGETISLDFVSDDKVSGWLQIPLKWSEEKILDVIGKDYYVA